MDDEELTVVKATRYTVVFGGEAHSGWLPPGAAMPARTPERVVDLELRILQNGSDGFLLEWAGPTAADSGDTWHPTIEEALEQAEASFGIKPSDWP
jgi:hypothetical protein